MKKSIDKIGFKYGVALVVLLMSLFSSCQEVKKPERPENLISKENMVSILSDLYIGNASRNVNNNLMRQKDIQLDSLIYSKYGIDSLQFAKSNAFYSTNLKTYGTILTKVQERLQVLKIEKDSLYKLAKKEDSINNKIKPKEIKIKPKKKEFKLMEPAVNN